MPRRIIRKERWLPVVGYEGYYEVSDLGRVRSLDRVVHYPPSRSHLNGYARLWKGQVLLPSSDKRGYRSVNLCRDGEVTTCSVHRLVLEAHVGPCHPGWVACHGEAGVSDNSVSNLEWGPQEKNLGEDKRRDGTMTQPAGEAHPNAKLTWEKVQEIKIRLAAGENQYKIAADYGVSQGRISAIKQGQTWRDEDDPIFLG